jgi:short-subunit dehydrogenase
MTGESKTAFITGASSGIGESFARILASHGYNLIITARRANLLNQLARDLEDMYSVTVRTVIADLSLSSDIDNLVDLIQEEQRIDMLINNAGFGTRKSFKTADPKRHQAMINVHLLATTRLTHAVIPIMLKNGKGSIINVSSLAGIMPVAGVVYSGTKAYINTFSRLLQKELRNTGIKVQALCPGFTYSGFHDTDDFKDWNRETLPRIFWMSAEAVVKYSLKSIKKNKIIVIPGMTNKILALFKWFFMWFAGIMIKIKTYNR